MAILGCLAIVDMRLPPIQVHQRAWDIRYACLQQTSICYKSWLDPHEAKNPQSTIPDSDPAHRPSEIEV
ncbi:hypothetical protein DL93DRAFT_545802 [Clavulina sp. PMI_390]|nr:hypothetical protein DL93DRAFT_545802 [Clavulina sp. PMI_390]